MKTYPYEGKTLIRVESEFKCLGCEFLDEETASCLLPVEIEFSIGCMELKDGIIKHFQFREAEKQD